MSELHLLSAEDTELLTWYADAAGVVNLIRTIARLRSTGSEADALDADTLEDIMHLLGYAVVMFDAAG